MDTALETARPEPQPSPNPAAARGCGRRRRGRRLPCRRRGDARASRRSPCSSEVSAAGVASPPWTVTVAFALLCLTLYWSRGLYRLRFRLHVLDDLRSIFVATTLAAMIVLTAASCFGTTADLDAETVRLWGFALAYVAAGRVARYWAHERVERSRARACARP